MWDDEDVFDRAIDRVARDLTSDSPGADLKARVLERINQRDARRVPWRLGWAALAAGVALVFLAMVVARPFERRDGTSQNSGQAHGDRAPDSAGRHLGTTVRSAQNPDHAGQETMTGTARQSFEPVRRSKPLQPPASEIAALAPEPLDVERIKVAAIAQIAPIQLSELTVPSIEVAPLSTDEDRPRH